MNVPVREHKFIFGIKLCMFRHFLCPTSAVFHCTHSNGICHTGILTACEQDQDIHPDRARKLSANLYALLCVQ